jgi:hypothetical protein
VFEIRFPDSQARMVQPRGQVLGRLNVPYTSFATILSLLLFIPHAIRKHQRSTTNFSAQLFPELSKCAPFLADTISVLTFLNLQNDA